VGLVWSNDPESCPGRSDVIGMASRARQVKGDDPDKKGYPGPPVWGLGVRLQSHPVKLIFVEKIVKLETGRKQQRRDSMNKD